MGDVRHDAIIVTSWNADRLKEAQVEAIKCGLAVSFFVAGKMNGYVSFLVAPDGSKEGWQESDAGDANRSAFVEWLDCQVFEDGSSKLDWVEVRYSDPNGAPSIVAGSEDPTPAACPDCESLISIVGQYLEDMDCGYDALASDDWDRLREWFANRRSALAQSEEQAPGDPLEGIVVQDGKEIG